MQKIGVHPVYHRIAVRYNNAYVKILHHLHFKLKDEPPVYVLNVCNTALECIDAKPIPLGWQFIIYTSLHTSHRFAL